MREPVVAEEIVGDRRLVTKREELIQLDLRKGLAINAPQTFEDAIVGFRAEPAADAVRS